MPLLHAYADAVHAVRAEESLTGISDARVGGMPIKPAAAREHLRALERAAAAHIRAKPANPRRLRAAGIGVEHHTKGAGSHGRVPGQ